MKGLHCHLPTGVFFNKSAITIVLDSTEYRGSVVSDLEKKDLEFRQYLAEQLQLGHLFSMFHIGQPCIERFTCRILVHYSCNY